MGNGYVQELAAVTQHVSDDDGDETSSAADRNRSHSPEREATVDVTRAHRSVQHGEAARHNVREYLRVARQARVHYGEAPGARRNHSGIGKQRTVVRVLRMGPSLKICPLTRRLAAAQYSRTATDSDRN